MDALTKAIAAFSVAASAAVQAINDDYPSEMSRIKILGNTFPHYSHSPHISSSISYHCDQGHIT